jgi:hypothetical protein
MSKFFIGFGSELLKIAQAYDPFGKQTAGAVGIPGALGKKNVTKPLGPKPTGAGSPQGQPKQTTQQGGGSGAPAVGGAASRMRASQRAGQQMLGALGAGKTPATPKPATPKPTGAGAGAGPKPAAQNPSALDQAFRSGLVQTGPGRGAGPKPAPAAQQTPGAPVKPAGAAKPAAAAPKQRGGFDVGRHGSAVFGGGGGSGGAKLPSPGSLGGLGGGLPPVKNTTKSPVPKKFDVF